MFEEGEDELDGNVRVNDGIDSNGCQENDDEIQCIDLQLDEIG